MFVMLSVRSTTVHERKAKTGKEYVNTINASAKELDTIKRDTNDIISNKLNNNCITNNTLVKAISFDKNITKTNYLLTDLNNFKAPPTVQAPVATILNDLSPVPAPVKVINEKGSLTSGPMNPKVLPDTPDIKAMRYYRLWIYTCNAVLLISVIIFCGVAGKVLVADYRRLLVNGINLGHPSFIYAYIALLFQTGFLQLIGCLGALRLSEKLLNAYWLLLLMLLIGDAIVGIFWMFKFDRIMHDIQPMLRSRLLSDYGVSTEFTELWDRLQYESRCCGATGPQDFLVTSVTNRSYPISCCSSEISEQITVSRRPLASAVVLHDDLLANSLGIKVNTSEISETWSHTAADNRDETRTITACRAVYPQGCSDKMKTWLKNTADILLVIGYCVIAFLKLSFLGILRYEIKEMIQKIKLLQNELTQSMLGQDIEQSHIQNTLINGGIHAEPKIGNIHRERNRIGSCGDGEHESLLAHDTTPKYVRHKQLHKCATQESDRTTAAASSMDSDANQPCAFIVEDCGGPSTGQVPGKNLNGNNNYELSEFDAKTPTYSHVRRPNVTRI